METMDDSVRATCLQLMSALEVVMGHTAGRDERVLANQMCENFKHESPDSVKCGFYLARLGNPPIARHYGFQLIEHAVKFRWHSWTVELKTSVKEEVMETLKHGTDNTLNEQFYIKNAISKIIVEMIKHEWPQQWPNLFDEIGEISRLGEVQMELVLLIFKQLAEDIVEFQNVENKRRRELLQGLNNHMEAIFQSFLQTLCSEAGKYIALSQKPNPTAEEQQQALTHCRVAQTVLGTINAYVDWVNMAVVFMSTNNSTLMHALCQLLVHPHLQLPAAECLVQLMGRKGKLEDRTPLLDLLKENLIPALMEAARLTTTCPLDEHNYNFIKRLCQVLVGLGFQLCSLWANLKPENMEAFAAYFDVLLEFTQHDSLMLSSYVVGLWAAFLRHKDISQRIEVKNIIPSLAQIGKMKMLKVGCPSHTSHSSSVFSRMDVDSDEEFHLFFSHYRVEFCEVIRLASTVRPDVTFAVASHWLQELTSSQLHYGPGAENGLCNLSSPSFIQWDALTVYMESVCKALTLEQVQPTTEQAIVLLKSILMYDTQDPLILSSSLSCISPLLYFLTLKLGPDIIAKDPNLLSTVLPDVLTKIFQALTFSLPGQTKATRSKAVKNLRRHACSSLVRICKQYPQLLLSQFDRLYLQVKQLEANPGELSQMERCTAKEALILIKNHFHNYTVQCAFIKELVEPVESMWRHVQLNQIFAVPSNFLAFVGLDKPPVEPSVDDTHGLNRSQLTYCISVLLAVIKRSQCPENVELAKSGGFVCGIQANGNPITRNPATINVGPLMDFVFHLLRVLNNLWIPNAIESLSPEYAKAYDMLLVDKKNVLGITNSTYVDNTELPIVRTPLDRIQKFMTNIHDNCYHILGSVGPNLGYELYMAPKLAEYINSFILKDLKLVPDYRLRPLIRSFMKPYIQSCPPEFYTSAVVPVLTELCPFMHERLATKWDQASQPVVNNIDSDEDNPENQEILDDQLNRQLTREYLDLLGAIFIRRHHMETTPQKVMEEEDDNLTKSKVTAMDEDMDRLQSLSELGQICFNNEVILQYTVQCCFRCLSWDDSQACIRSLTLCTTILNQLIAKNLADADAQRLFQAILMGLQRHGQHDMCRSPLLALGLHAYEILRPTFPSVVDVFLSIPGCSESDVKAFEDKLAKSADAPPNKKIPIKAKKMMFKNLIESIIGINVSQLFRNPIQIRNLPPLLPFKNRSAAPSELDNKDLGLASLFNSNQTILLDTSSGNDAMSGI